jgi:hypothetical protein
MSETLTIVRRLAAAGEVKVSDHGYDEMAEDGIFARDVVAGVADGLVVEDYPGYAKLPLRLGAGKRPGRKALACRMGNTKGPEFARGGGHGLSARFDALDG